MSLESKQTTWNGAQFPFGLSMLTQQFQLLRPVFGYAMNRLHETEPPQEPQLKPVH